MTNDFLYPGNIKIDEKEPRSSEQILPVPWGSTVLTEDKVFMSPTGDKTDSSTSLEQRSTFTA